MTVDWAAKSHGAIHDIASLLLIDTCIDEATYDMICAMADLWYEAAKLSSRCVPPATMFALRRIHSLMSSYKSTLAVGQMNDFVAYLDFLDGQTKTSKECEELLKSSETKDDTLYGWIG